MNSSKVSHDVVSKLRDFDTQLYNFRSFVEFKQSNLYNFYIELVGALSSLIKDSLLNSHDKYHCSYSQLSSFNFASKFELDHYRPAELNNGKVRSFSSVGKSPRWNQIKRELLIDYIPEYLNDNNSYYFLSSSIDNLYYVSPKINKIKTNYFPIRHDSCRAVNAYGISFEHAFLLEPESINITRFNVDSSGVMIPASRLQLGENNQFTKELSVIKERIINNWNYVQELSTIVILKLNDEILMEYRRIHYRLVTALIIRNDMNTLKQLYSSGLLLLVTENVIMGCFLVVIVFLFCFKILN